MFPKRLRCLWVAALCLLAGAEATHAQPGYSVEETLAEATWETERLAPGVTWKRAQIEGLFGLPQSLNVLVVDLAAEGVEIDVAFSDSGRVKTSALARRVGAVAAVNGSFFDTEDGTPVVFSQSDGRLRATLPEDGPAFLNRAAVAAERDGDAQVIRKKKLGEQRMPRFEDVLAGGPLLLWDGRVADLQATSFNVTHHPRTAMGVAASGRRLVLATVDGRTRQAAGMTARELAWTMRGLGCATAVNLDGGGSTTMWAQGRGVVSYPADNEAYDHDGERGVANAVVVFAGEK
jgi:exopolysaccharide biosynthesis protein